jgi:suppressor of G2 allele of SKP1
LEVVIQLGEGKEYSLDLDLCGEVVPEESKYEVLSTKIEIRMKKATTAQWSSLEDNGQGV